MAHQGSPRIFSKKYKFIVDIDDIGSMAFQSCSELSVEVAKVEHWEGGVAIPDKTPGRLTYSDITLERGATADADLFHWLTEIANVTANAGGPGIEPALYKRNLDIVQLDRSGLTKYRWRVYNAWIQKHSAGDWDNNADETVIESVVLTYDYYDLIGGLVATAAP